MSYWLILSKLLAIMIAIQDIELNTGYRVLGQHVTLILIYFIRKKVFQKIVILVT